MSTEESIRLQQQAAGLERAELETEEITTYCAQLEAAVTALAQPDLAPEARAMFVGAAEKATIDADATVARVISVLVSAVQMLALPQEIPGEAWPDFLKAQAVHMEVSAERLRFCAAAAELVQALAR
jgi:hypothetical protein